MLKTTERDSTASDVLDLRKMLDRYMELMQEIILEGSNPVLKGEAFSSVGDLLIFFGRRNNIVRNPVLAPMVYQVLVQNGMLRHALGAVILFSLQHFIAPALDYCPACKPEVREIARRAVNTEKALK